MFWINYDVHDMYRDGWLKIGDTTNSPGDPDNKKCGSVCTSHSFRLTSEVNQRVFVATSVWWSRGYPDACKEGATKSGSKTDPNGGRKHVFRVQGHEKEYTFNQGTEMPEPFMMRADETRDLYIEIDFTRREMAHDVSVVAWGEDGPVSLVHTGRIPSDSWEGSMH